MFKHRLPIDDSVPSCSLDWHRKIYELMGTLSFTNRVLSGALILAGAALFPAGLTFAFLCAQKRLYPFIPFGLLASVVGPVLSLRYVDAGWRWRVRDGNRLPWEKQIESKDVNPTEFAVSHISLWDVWSYLSSSGRKRFVARCIEFVVFMVFFTWLGFDAGMLSGIAFGLGTTAAFIWFLTWVRQFVQQHGHGSNPWGNNPVRGPVAGSKAASSKGEGIKRNHGQEEKP